MYIRHSKSASHQEHMADMFSLSRLILDSLNSSAYPPGSRPSPYTDYQHGSRNTCNPGWIDAWFYNWIYASTYIQIYTQQLSPPTKIIGQGTNKDRPRSGSTMKFRANMLSLTFSSILPGTLLTAASYQFSTRPSDRAQKATFMRRGIKKLN